MNTVITVIGLGYIGLPTALLLASAGNIVQGFDVSESRVNLLQSGKLPFSEPELPELWTNVQNQHTFQATKQILPADIFLIAVPTPQHNYKADLTYVLQALDSVRPVMKPGDTIIVESTIGPIDSRRELLPLIESWGIPFHYAYCPERAIPGKTIQEMVHNIRIVGGRTPQDAESVKQLYSSFVKGEIYCTDPTTAAVCKLMENTYRDVNIALANEFAKLSDELHFDVWEAIRLANFHPRVHLHQPGPGVGGHCIAIDPWYFVGESNQADVIKLARQVNNSMPQYLADQIKKIITAQAMSNPTIGLLGYAYKKNVDDARESPAQSLFSILEKDYSCVVHDPLVKTPIPNSVPLDKLLADSSLVVVVTDHDNYKNILFSQYPNIKYIYDARHLISPQQLEGSSAKLITFGTSA
jgi:nucleotide sugar dehydrogenase